MTEKPTNTTPVVDKDSNVESNEIILPDFVYNKDGRIMTGMGDKDVTVEYHDFLKSLGMHSEVLPDFLYEDTEGNILLAEQNDTDVTEKWEDWINSLVPIEEEKELG